MVGRIRMVFFLVVVAVGAVREPPLRGIAFAQQQGQLQENGDPCPPECVTDSMEIVTWYPSPYNEYEELRLYPKRNSEESQCNSFERLGLMYYNQDEYTLKICRQDPDTLNYNWEKIPVGQEGYWDLSGSDIYNTNSGKISIATTDSNKVSLDASGAVRIGNYATVSRPACSSAILGALVYDTTEKRPYVCALNSGNSPVWKPLDSDYDKDGITDAVDANDNDFNDATAFEADVASGKTFYSRGGSRRTGTLSSLSQTGDVGGVCVTTSYDTNGFCLTDIGWEPKSTGYECGAYAGNAFCGNRWCEHRCKCPAGYTSTKLYEIGLGYGRNAYFYYCKKN